MSIGRIVFRASTLAYSGSRDFSRSHLFLGCGQCRAAIASTPKENEHQVIANAFARLLALIRSVDNLDRARPDDSEALFEPQERALQLAVGERAHSDCGGKSENHRYQLGGKGT